MFEFLESLTIIEKFYAGCAIFGAALFVIRTVMMFAGGGDYDDLDGAAGGMQGDADASFKILSLQSLTAFFMMFGLTALVLSRQSGAAHVWAASGGMAAGLFTVWVIGRIFAGMRKLHSDGTLRIENAVGREGEVYLPVAPGKTGQVRVSVQGQLRVFDAATEGADTLGTGARIRVVSVTPGSVLLVEKA